MADEFGDFPEVLDDAPQNLDPVALAAPPATPIAPAAPAQLLQLFAALLCFKQLVLVWPADAVNPKPKSLLTCWRH